MTNEQLKQLLKEAFQAGVHHEYTLDEYIHDEIKYEDIAPPFLEWYDKNIKGTNLFWTEEIDDSHLETLRRNR
jgi:hypothetical protein